MSAARGPRGVDPARSAAYEVLRRTFEHGAWTDRAFPAAADRHGLADRARARAQWLAYGAVQRRGTTDHVVRWFARRRAERLDAPVTAALRLGAFELLWAGSAADHAAVGDAVELAKSGLVARGARRAQAGAGFVNAVLRRVAREREAIMESLTDDDPGSAAVAHSVPGWLAQMWWEELGPGVARELMRAANRPVPSALRVNTLRVAPADLRRRLAADSGGDDPLGEDVAAGRVPPLWPPEALQVGRLGTAAVQALEAGDAFAQALGAQAVVELLDPRPEERVLDLCAGPGVKTVAIAARMRGSGELIAVEADAARAGQIEELCARAGAVNVRVIHGDARGDLPGGHYDRVLVDPPCSDLGTLASRPDARWRKSAETITELVPLQRDILARGLRALAPGGTLVYSTCTISRRENEDVVRDGAGGAVVEDLGARHPALRSSHDGRFLQIRPDRDGTDGFFVARLGAAS